MGRKNKRDSRYDRSDFYDLMEELKHTGGTRNTRKKVEAVIVTKNPVVSKFFRTEYGVNAKVVPHAKEQDVKGKHVYGHVPIALAAVAECVTSVHADVRESDLKNMSLEEYKNRIVKVETYKVTVESVEYY